jgi:hypothetical protein
MMKTEMTEAELHSAGATVRHHSPFADLMIPTSEKDLSPEDVQKWVIPFYLADLVTDREKVTTSFVPLAPLLTLEVVRQLLGQMNWRPRIVAAYFAAIMMIREVEGDLGRLLLRSDVCFAGGGYCLALACFNTSISRDYLHRYLEYYLRQPDLWFDQGDALAALTYLDEINSTHEAEQFADAWQSFIANKPHWSRADQQKRFCDRMTSLERIRERIRSQQGGGEVRS